MIYRFHNLGLLPCNCLAAMSVSQGLITNGQFRPTIARVCLAGDPRSKKYTFLSLINLGKIKKIATDVALEIDFSNLGSSNVSLEQTRYQIEFVELSNHKMFKRVYITCSSAFVSVRENVRELEEERCLVLTTLRQA